MDRASGAKFPDVFSPGFRDKLDRLAKKTCTPLRDAKYCLGYAYFDMPDFKLHVGGTIDVSRSRTGLSRVQDMRSLPAAAAGKGMDTYSQP